MTRWLKVATPLTTVALTATDWLLTTRVKAPPLPEEIAAVMTVELSWVTVLPKLSTTLTTGMPASSAPVLAPIGWLSTTTRTGAPGITVTFAEFTPIKAPDAKPNW